MIALMLKVKEKIKSWLNDIDYSSWEIRIYSEALEYGMSLEEYNKQSYANYVNHYGENLKLKAALDEIEKKTF